MSQEDMLLKHLKAGGSVTGLEALDHLGIYRLASRISNLRKQGHAIISEDVVQDGKRFSRYRMSVKLPVDFFLSDQSYLQHEWSKK